MVKKTAYGLGFEGVGVEVEVRLEDIQSQAMRGCSGCARGQVLF